ncbi:MAG: hypothetical protein DCC44_08165 [Acidobacteria bacterium]|nr:MAG: hypothetical protein DCC44_08165 [Acidobacteriota bacterium]
MNAIDLFASFASSLCVLCGYSCLIRAFVANASFVSLCLCGPFSFNICVHSVELNAKSAKAFAKFAKAFAKTAKGGRD